MEDRRQAAQAALDAAGAETVRRAAYADYLARFGADVAALDYAAWSAEQGEEALGAYRLSLIREETYRQIMRRLGQDAPDEEEVAETAALTTPEWFFRSFLPPDEA